MGISLDKIKSQFGKASVAGPWFAGATATCGALAGMLGSVYSNEIKSTWPLMCQFCLPTGTFSYQALLFWLLLFLFGLMFTAGYGGQTKAQQATLGGLQDAMRDRIDQLDRTLRTLPPDNYVTQFEEFFRNALGAAAHALESGIDSNVQKERLTSAIEVALGGLVTLAMSYDQPTTSVTYVGNILEFVPVPTDPSKLEDIRSKLRFYERGHDLNKLGGFLCLRTVVALANVDEAEARMEQDNGLVSLALPVPGAAELEKHGRSLVIPGAPTVWCFDAILKHYPDVQTIVEELTRSGLRHEVVEDARSYFAEDKTGKCVKSFIAMPFGVPEVKDSKTVTRKLGVITVHSSQHGILGESRSALYAPLTGPFRMLIGLLWERQRSLDP